MSKVEGTVMLPLALVTKDLILEGNGRLIAPAQVERRRGGLTLTLPATASYVVLE